MPSSGLGMASTRSVIAIANTASAKKISRSSASVLSTPDATSEPWGSVSPAAPWPASTVSEAYPAPFGEAGDVIEKQHLLVLGSMTKGHTRSMRRSERDPAARTVLDAATATFVAVICLGLLVGISTQLRSVRAQASRETWMRSRRSR